MNLSVELLERMTLDGTFSMMMAVNEQIPGPPIILHQGQEVRMNGYQCPLL